MAAKGKNKKVIFLFLIAPTLMFMAFWAVRKSDKAYYMKDYISSDLVEKRKLQSTYLRHCLVDITEYNLLGWTSKGVLKNSEQFHRILWYNRPSWLKVDRINQLTKECTFNNCHHTEDKSFLKNSSAVVFSIVSGGLSKDPPLKPSERPAKQVWIYFGRESPATQQQYFPQLIPTWKDSFNWSTNFRLDSDLVFPYGYLKTRSSPRQTKFSAIFHKKTKWAAWIVSKCKTPSMRSEFVEKLTKHGLPVDIYGRCGKELKTDPERLISNQYRFYLSFENSMCIDYITEKFFKYYNYDTILVVRGGADYKRLLPRNTFIDTADFESFSQLVDYLKVVGNNETLYTNYIRNKERFMAVWDLEFNNSLVFCAFCVKLNNVDHYQKSYEIIPKYLEKCYTPGDIDTMDILKLNTSNS